MIIHNRSTCCHGSILHYHSLLGKKWSYVLPLCCFHYCNWLDTISFESQLNCVVFFYYPCFTLVWFIFGSRPQTAPCHKYKPTLLVFCTTVGKPSQCLFFNLSLEISSHTTHCKQDRIQMCPNDTFIIQIYL